MQDAHAEWRAGPAARQGRQCQDCHPHPHQPRLALRGSVRRRPRARSAHALVVVDPDPFYRDFYAHRDPASLAVRRLLEEARGAIAESAYILFARQIRLPGDDP